MDIMSKFTVEKNKKKIRLEFKAASGNDLIEAQKLYSKTFTSLLDEGGLLRDNLATKLKKQGLWSEEKQEKLEKLQKAVVDNEHALHKGNISLKEAREIALQIRADRTEQAFLLVDYQRYDKITIEGQADNAQFNYLVSVCTVYSKHNKPYFKDYYK